MKPGLTRWMTILGAGVFLAGLGLFAYLGRYNRLWADDWCYNADFQTIGLLGALKGYTHITTYASNRFSLTLFSGLIYPGRVLGVQLMTPLVLLLWLAGLAWLVTNLAKRTGFTITRWTVLLAAALPLYYTLYLAPHLYQELYWRSGLLPYTAPLVGATWIFALISWQAAAAQPSRLALPLAGGLAFLTGGFSESACACLVAALGLYLAWAGLGRARRQPWAVRSFPAAGVALLCALLAMVVLIAAPTSQLRAQRYGDPTGLAQLPALLTFLTYQFAGLSIKQLPVPHLALGLTAALLGFLVPAGSHPLPLRRLVWSGLAIGAAAFILIAASLAPSAYIERGLMAARAQIIPRFILTAALASGAWLAGAWLGPRLPAKGPAVVAAGLLLGCYAYAGWTGWQTAGQAQLYAGRAAVWDARDLVLRQAHLQGLTEVQVRAIDGAPVGGLRDFKPEARHWVNQCAERYYGVKAIRADED